MEEETEDGAGVRVARSRVFNHFARSQWYGTGNEQCGGKGLGVEREREIERGLERQRVVSRNVSYCFRLPSSFTGSSSPSISGPWNYIRWLVFFFSFFFFF